MRRWLTFLFALLAASASANVRQGQTGGLGLLTGRAASGGSAAAWSATVVDGYGRVAGEQDSLMSRSAIGLAAGAGTVSATLDGHPLNVQFDGPLGSGQWQANMDLAPGPHTLAVSAVDLSGLCFGGATNTFACSTNSGDTIQDFYYVDGNVNGRLWSNAQGQTTRSQWFAWDAFNRLIGVQNLDAQNNGYNWSAVYDGLGRRVSTVNTMVVSNTPVTGLNPGNAVSEVDSWYDPQAEFLEVGVTVSGPLGATFTLKTYGPDANGVYGGMNGVGGLESIAVQGHSASTGMVQDFFGNVIGTITNGVVSWSPARFSSYGPVPGYQPPSLSLDVGLAPSLGWRGKRVDETGYIYLGARLYDPVAGRFLSADPLGHAASQDLYSFCGGDPVNRFDPDGRCVEGTAAGWTSAPIPGNASSAFMAGYYGGGVAAGYNEGWNQGKAIVADTASFGQIDSLHSYTSTLQGGVYDWSRGFADVGVGAAALATGGALLEAAPALYVGAVNVSVNPWTYVAGGGAVSGYLTYQQGGSAQDVAVSTVVGAGLTYASSPFAIGDESPPPTVITQPYQRPSGATTAAQRASVQGQPCVDCGATEPTMVADHTYPLVQEYYETGTIDLGQMRSIDAVQPQCPTCSAQQGAQLRIYSMQQRQNLPITIRKQQN